MKVIILAGGWGSRLGSLTDFIPKPMVKIGKYPILWIWCDEFCALINRDGNRNYWRENTS